MIISMRYVILYVEDFERSLRFYRDILGLPVRAQHGTYVEFDTGYTILAFNTRQGGREATGLTIPDAPSHSQTLELGLVVDEVSTIIKSFRQQGVTILKEPSLKPWGQTVAYIEDPDGHLIEICSSLD